MAKLPPPQTIRGLLPEARRVVLPAGIAATGAPGIIAVAEKIGLGLDPWQCDICRVIFAKTAHGLWAAEDIGISIPRQSGKTYLVAAVVFAYCLANPGVTVAWTAHHNKVMLETFDGLKKAAGLPKVRPRVARTPSSAEYRAVEFINGSRIVMAARESGALRGVAKVSILVLDEAQILTDNAMSDMLPTQNQAEKPLTIMMGTPPRPKDPGEVFTQQRLQALEAERLGEPLELAAWIEFSADEDAETDDREQWSKANPSYPDRTPERAIRKLRRLLTEDHFRREALGIWDDKSAPSVIPPSSWEQAADIPTGPRDGLVTLALDTSPAGDMTTVAACAQREDGAWQVEIFYQAPGVTWVPAWLQQQVESGRFSGVVIDKQCAPLMGLADQLKAAGVRLTITELADMRVACSAFLAGVIEGVVKHSGQPQLTYALSQASKRDVEGGWAWSRRSSSSDITPVVAVTLALWGARSSKTRKQKTSIRGQGRASGREATVS